jgi:hypothetical protein
MPATSQEPKPDKPPRVLRLPGFVADEDVGLGTVVKRATSLVGIKPCGGCAERAARLDRRVRFAPRTPRSPTPDR